MSIRWEQFWIAFDQLVNTLVDGGWADETISARAYRLGSGDDAPRKWKIAYKAINLLFFRQENHCQEAYLNEQARNHMPKEYRG